MNAPTDIEQAEQAALVAAQADLEKKAEDLQKKAAAEAARRAKREKREAEEARVRDESPNGAGHFGSPWTLSSKGEPDGLNQRYWAQALSDAVFFEKVDGQFYRFRGGVWVSQSKAEIRALIDETVRECVCRWDLEVRLEKALSDRVLSGAVAALESFTTRTRAFEASPENVIYTANGRLEKDGPCWSFEAGDAGRPEDLKRGRFPAAYDPEAQAPKLTAWLDRIFSGREDDIEAVQKFAGACLSGKNIWKKLLVIEGRPDLGKGKLLHLLSKIAGEDSTEALRTKFLEDRFEARRFVGKSLLVAGDVPEDFLTLQGATKLKEIVGGDRIAVENKGNDSGAWMTGHFNVCVASNFRLKVRSGIDVEAWRTRLVYLVADGQPYQGGEKDLCFLESLWSEEGPGILNWALAGLRKLQEDGDWIMSDRQREVVADLLDESRSVTLFVNERTEEAAFGGITTESLFDGYRAYCDDRGWRGFSRHAFEKAIPDIIYDRYRVGGDIRVEIEQGVKRRGYPGIRVKPLEGARP